MISILSWLLFGLIVGAIAKMIMPGSQNMGWLLTIILGIVGAFVGGFVGRLIGIGEDGEIWDFGSIAMATLGAIIVMFIYGALTKGRN